MLNCSLFNFSLLPHVPVTIAVTFKTPSEVEYLIPVQHIKCCCFTRWNLKLSVIQVSKDGHWLPASKGDIYATAVLNKPTKERSMQTWDWHMQQLCNEPRLSSMDKYFMTCVKISYAKLIKASLVYWSEIQVNTSIQYVN